jgi:hypothetical protein
MNYQGIRAAIENPILTAFTNLSPSVPVFFDNITAAPLGSVTEYVRVNITFGITNEVTLSSSVDNARGAIIIRIYSEKGKGPARNQTLVTTAVNVIETLNATAKTNSGVFFRTGIQFFLRIMAVTCLSGTSGALYYKPAGTKGTFGTAGVDINTETITVETYLNFKVGDPVKFSVINSQTGGSGTGTLPAGLTTSDTFYVIAYTATTGALQVSATSGGSALNITDVGTAAQFVPFRKYIAGFGDGTGSATAYMTNEDTALVNRMVQDVLQRQQVGASLKLYIDQVFTGGSVSDTLSRFIEFDATLTSAAMNVNPDDAQSVTVEFRPASQPTFDFSAAA